ncbi:ABC transporter permease [Sphingobium sp. CFD-1]|uniref:ABC transporter permease n=1 Tax=Sphingobium sp. CFD-1 TaxID=2878545 RepID=UPI00214BFF09|nr:ABC transporter permease [Sphingobium sp. CFD-1]
MASRPALSRSFAIQCRVIWALFLRETLTRYGRHNIGVLWLFAEPMTFTLGITAIWTITKLSHSSQIPIVAFAVTGYSTVLVWRNMPNRLDKSVEMHLGLMHHRNVRPIDIYIARLMLEIGGVTTSFVVLSLGFSAMGWMALPEDVLKVIWGWVLMVWFGSALAIIVGAISEHSELFERFWHPFTYIMIGFSGLGFIVDAMPHAAQEYLLLVPMVNCAEIIRDGYFGSLFKAHYDVGYVLIWNAVLSLFAMVGVRSITAKVTPL